MSWQAGDLALCVRGRGPFGGCERAPDECSPIKSALFPSVGSKWRVDGVETHEHSEWEGGGVFVYLKLAGQPSDIVFDARCFRKIDEHQADAEDAETIRLLSQQPAEVTQ